MAERELRLVRTPPPPEATAPLVPSLVLGVLILIIAEVMLFGGLISAYAIAKSNATMWPPPNQPRLPIELTLVNTLALLASGVVIWWAGRRFEEARERAWISFLVAYGLGAFFVVFQGVEWVRLIGEGLTLTASTHAAFFYLIVGMHGLHVLGGLAALTLILVRFRRGTLTSDVFWAGRVFWYFVVGLWPILYWRVYL